MKMFHGDAPSEHDGDNAMAATEPLHVWKSFAGTRVKGRGYRDGLGLNNWKECIS
jgi:hypothetical protein